MGDMRAEIPPEVTEFKEKFFFGLTVRQLVCSAGMLALTIPTGFFGKNYLSSDMVQWAVVLEAAPFIAMGFIRYNDMPFEKIARKVWNYYFTSQRRKVKYTPPIIALHDEMTEVAYIESIAIRKAEKKALKEQKKKNKGKGVAKNEEW
jgi:hypothetical protein